MYDNNLIIYFGELKNENNETPNIYYELLKDIYVDDILIEENCDNYSDYYLPIYDLDKSSTHNLKIVFKTYQNEEKIITKQFNIKDCMNAIEISSLTSYIDGDYLVVRPNISKKEDEEYYDVDIYNEYYTMNIYIDDVPCYTEEYMCGEYSYYDVYIDMNSEGIYEDGTEKTIKVELTCDHGTTISKTITKRI